jgi:potassium voltage-gated channel Shab-related subfamily B protein 1
LNKGSNTNKVGPSEPDPTKVGWAEDDLSVSLQPIKSENKAPLTRKSSWTGTVVPTPEEIKKSREIHRRVILNVGGERHEILWDNLERHPYTRLGQLKECQTHEETMDVCDDYLIEGNEYFWDRQPRSFALILNLYRKDKLHLPEDLCVMDFAEDLEYWGIDELFLDSCCQMKFSQKKEALNEEIKKDEEFLLYHKEEEFGGGFLAEYRKYLWDLFEKSDTLPQKVFLQHS